MSPKSMSLNSFILLFCQLSSLRCYDAATLVEEGKSDLTSESIQNQFERFQTEYGKTYGSEDEKELRLNIFGKNLKLIEELNASDRGTAAFGITEHADLTLQEFKQKFNLDARNLKKYLSSVTSSVTSWGGESNVYARQDESEVSEVRMGMIATEIDLTGKSDNSSTPTTCKDWTEKSNPYMTPVKDIGKCLGSWAVGPTDCIEIAYSAKVKKITQLSAQQVIDCAPAQHCDKLTSNIKEWEKYFKKPGLVAESDYPWVGIKKNYTCGLADKSKYVVQVKSIANANSDKKITTMLNTVPVCSAITSDGFQFYKSGVLDLDATKCSHDTLDNLVSIVGCGSETGKDGKSIEYWVVKNNMGASWGMKGYANIRKGVCGIGSPAFYYLVE